uniref:F-box domain-containing protein n=1 Tax=Strongyloides venezuelensis TaxID=75913 RepID=A0A0K0FZR3_STRVS
MIDEPTIDFVSLPEKFKLQVFRELDWQTLKNLKLVCKNFCLTIEKNIQSLDRPKAYSMSIGYDGTKISSVLYRLMLTGSIEGIGSLKTVFFSNYDESENFLSNIDLTEIKELCLRSGPNGEYISVQCKTYSDGKFSKYNFSSKFQNGQLFEMHLCNRIYSNKKFGILYDDHFLRSETLRKLGFFGKDGSRLVKKKIVMDLLTGNPMLKYENAPTGIHNPLYIQLMNHLFKIGFFNLENTCSRSRFKLSFDKVSKFSVVRQKFYRKIFDKIKFNNNLVEEDNDDVYSIKSSMKCSKCSTEHEISIIYKKNFKDLWIHIGFCNDDQYENFIKFKDFTKIRELRLENLSSKECISIDYTSTVVGSISLYGFVYISPNRRDFIVYLDIAIKSNEMLAILSDNDLLRKRSLRKFGLFGRNRPHSVGKKIAIDLLTENPMLG